MPYSRNLFAAPTFAHYAMQNSYTRLLQATLLPCLLAAAAHAQVPLPAPPEDKQQVAPKDTTYWSRTFKFAANLTQANFSSNWKAGGVSNISYSTLLQAKANYIRGRHTWNSEVDFQYGSVKNAGTAFRKSLDKLYIDSKYGYAFAKAWSFYGSLNLLTQFDNGYKYIQVADPTSGDKLEQGILISRFFAPAYITQSTGVEYKPVDYFFIRFGTGTLRQTIVGRQVDSALTKNYGVPFGKKVRNEVAFQLMASFDRDIMKNINLKVRYITFINYEKLATLADYDQRLEATLLAKVNKYISTTASALLIYDRDADDKVQFNQTLGLGLLIAIGDTK